MAEPEVIVIEKMERAEDDKGKPYGKITDQNGKNWNIKEGRSKLFSNKGHLIEVGKAIKPTWAYFTKDDGTQIPWIQDFELVENVFEQEAATKIATRMGDDRGNSIESQVAQKGGIETLKVLIEQAILTEEELARCKRYAFQAVDWGVGRLNPAVEVMSVIKGAKDETKVEPILGLASNPDDSRPEPQEGIKNAEGLAKAFIKEGIYPSIACGILKVAELKDALTGPHEIESYDDAFRYVMENK